MSYLYIILFTFLYYFNNNIVVFSEVTPSKSETRYVPINNHKVFFFILRRSFIDPFTTSVAWSLFYKECCCWCKG